MNFYIPRGKSCEQLTKIGMKFVGYSWAWPDPGKTTQHGILWCSASLINTYIKAITYLTKYISEIESANIRAFLLWVGEKQN